MLYDNFFALILVSHVNIRGLVNGLTGIHPGVRLIPAAGRRRVVFLVGTLVYVLCSIAILQVYHMVPGDGASESSRTSIVDGKKLGHGMEEMEAAI